MSHQLLSEIKNKALLLLSRREHSVYELQQKLKRAFETKQKDEDAGSEPSDQESVITTIAMVIEEMQGAGYLSDERYAEMVLRARSARGYGALRVRQELQQQKVDGEVIALCLEASEIDWFELARASREKKFGAASKSMDQKLRAKQQRFLYSRGFSPDQINYALEPQTEDE
jgi:regulatory protein